MKTSIAPQLGWAVAALLGCQDPDGPVEPHLPTNPASAPELAAPSNLTALASSQTQIDINWQDNTRRETGFEIHRSTTGAPGTFTLLATVGAGLEAYSDPGLDPGAQYCYQVRAIQASTTSTTFSAFSNTACATAASVTLVTFASVFAGGAHTCALATSGAAYCWGRGESGQLGVPAPASTCNTDAGLMSCSMVPVPVGGGLTFTQLAGGGAHTCGLTGGGSVYCWGNNASGQLGDNSTTNRNAPVAVATGLLFTSIDAGVAHTCALTSAGAAYCWGRNDRGQLGTGSADLNPHPIPEGVSGSHTFQRIAAGGFFRGHTCGLDDTGDAYCWGDNELGQLGIGSSDAIPHPLPALVSGGLTFAALTAGLGRHSCGLTAAGAGWCWGENTFGALGNRSRKDSAVPVAVAGRRTLARLIAGGFIGHTCGLDTSGAGYCWGENEVGQVGDGTTVDRSAPTAVKGGLAFTTVDAGFRHSCGRASTGAMYCWGSNGAGQLGNNSNSLSTVPVKVFGQP
jgi:alpha-tubulin suppressor-like RCC1 family protein